MRTLKNTLNVRLQEIHYSQIVEFAKKHKLTVSTAVRTIIRSFLRAYVPENNSDLEEVLLADEYDVVHKVKIAGIKRTTYNLK
jgi:hypothetical protein